MKTAESLLQSLKDVIDAANETAPRLVTTGRDVAENHSVNILESGTARNPPRNRNQRDGLWSVL